MSRSSSPASRNRLGANSFSLLQKLYWFDLNCDVLGDIIAANPNPSKGYAACNVAFREAQPKLRQIHATTMCYTPGHFTSSYYNKMWYAGALRKMPVSCMWEILYAHKSFPTNEHTFDLRHRLRDEFKPGLTKGQMYDFVEQLISKFDAEVKFKDYDAVQNSPTKYRQGNANSYWDRREMLLLRNIHYGTGLNAPGHVLDSTSDSDTDKSTSTTDKSTSATDKPTIFANLKPKVEAETVESIASQVFDNSCATDSPLHLQYQQIDFDTAEKVSILTVCGHSLQSYEYGHRMPPFDATAEYHQCLACCFSAYTGVPLQEVRAQMKIASLEFTTDPTSAYRLLAGSQQKICDQFAMMSARADVSALRWIALSCIRDYDVVILTQASGAHDQDEAYIIDSFTVIPGVISDSCVFLLLRHDHFTVLRLPLRHFPTVRDFVLFTETAHGIIHTNHPKCPYWDTSTAFSTPDRRTNKGSPPLTKQEKSGIDKSGIDKSGIASTSENADAAQKGTSPLSAISLTESDTEVEAPRVPDTEVEAHQDHAHRVSLFLATGRGTRTMHPVLDEQGKTDMALKSTYLDSLIHKKQSQPTGPHTEATGKVVDAQAKKTELKQKSTHSASKATSYTAGKKWKNLNEKALVCTQMIKDGPQQGKMNDTDTEEEYTLVKIAKRTDKGNKLYGFFQKADGSAVTYTGTRVPNIPYPRQDHDFAYTMYKFGLTTEAKPMPQEDAENIRGGREATKSNISDGQDKADAEAETTSDNHNKRHASASSAGSSSGKKQRK